MSRVKILLSVLTCLAFLAMPSASIAQTTADIVGRISDTSGAVLPGATVTIENVGTNDVRTAVASETGDFVFPLLPIGTYTVKIELQGFGSQSTRVVLTSGDRTRVDGKLAVGNVSETVMVTGEAPLLQTDTSTLSTLVSEKAVQDLPVNGRNFIRLVQLVPGATEGAANSFNSGTRPDDRRQTTSVSINGALEYQNNQMIDGMDNNERAIGSIGVKPSMDAIAEVRVQTNLYPAETGRTGGGIINILTKSGTNQFHGTGFEFLRNDRFDERDYFATRDPILKQHQFGGSLGGPLVSSKTFFFVDYEGLRNTKGQVNTLTLPTMKMRAGDFSELLPATQIYDPTTSPRVAFPGNIIPADRLDPVTLQYMALLPVPTNGALANNYQGTTLGFTHSHTADVRIDHRFNGDNSVFGRYSYNGLDFLQPGGCPIAASGISAVCRGPETGGFPGSNTTKANALQMNYVRVFSPSLVGEFKGGYFKTNLASLPVNYNTKASEKFGLKNVNIDDIANGNGLATVTINGFTPLGDAGNIPLYNRNFSQQYSASLTKTRGAHTFKFGGAVVLRKFTVIQSQSPVGTWVFSPNLTRSSTNVGGNSAASFLLGYAATVTRNHTPYEPHVHTNEPGLYVQDDWHATSWLTLNFGIRYDIFTPFTDEDNLLSNIDLSVPKVLVAGQNGVSRQAGVKTDYSNVAPRFGMAVTLPWSAVIRGGYGISYFPGNIASPAYMKNPPLLNAFGPITSAGDTGGLPTVLFRDGLPVFTNTPPSIEPNQLSGQFRAVALDFKATRMHQFNVQMDKEFGANVVSVGYVGSRGQNVALSQGTANINLAPVGAGTVQPRRHFASILPNVTTLPMLQSVYENAYNAMQLVLQRRFTRGFSLTTHYRLAHATATASVPWDTFQFENTDAGQDVRHSFVLQANYALPWGQSLTGIKGGVLGGWQVNAVANWQTGTPFGVTNATERANTGGTDRPNLIGDPALPADQRTVAKWFNTAAFEAQPVFTVGNSPANVLHGPSQRRLDLSFFKELKLHTTTRLQLRYEVYNVTNTANFQNPNSALGNAAFGSISSTGNAIPRQMQFAMKLLF